MRVLAPLVVLALGGASACDRVFGLDGPHPDGGIDGPVVPADAHVVKPASSLMDFVIASDPSGSPLAILDVRNASATILGTPHTFVPYTLAASSGTFTPASGEIEVGDGGAIVLASTFTADGLAAPGGTARLSSGALGTDIPAATVGLVQIGATTQNGGTSAAAGDLFGTRLTASGTGYLKRVGITVGTATNAYIGVYSDVSGAPTTLLASLGPVALAAGANELVITNAHLPATFWIVALVETAQPSLPVGNSVSTDRFFQVTSTYGALPMTLSPVIPGTFRRYMQYVKATP